MKFYDMVKNFGARVAAVGAASTAAFNSAYAGITTDMSGDITTMLTDMQGWGKLVLGVVVGLIVYRIAAGMLGIAR